MTDYKELKVAISPFSSDAADYLASQLAEIGFDSFVDDNPFLLAYIPLESFDMEKVRGVVEDFPFQVDMQFSSSIIKGRNWNEEWEKNYFQPIVISDKCVIHSSFHKDVPKAKYDIVIDPKMAFGTGHHSTTSLIIRYLLELSLKDKVVIDMGTGTGILAILSVMRGAAKAIGIEIDPDAYANALENVRLNKTEVSLILGDASKLNGLKANLLIANINRNIILQDIEEYKNAVISGGELIFSGFYESDITLIEEKASSLGLQIIDSKTDNDWAAIRLSRV